MPSSLRRAPRPAPPTRGCVAIMVLAVGLACACIVDDDARCSPKQFLDDGLCRCIEGTMQVGNGCVASVLDASMDADGGAAPEGGLGATCSAEAPCTSPAYPSCQVAPSGAHYCTSTGCTGASDCPSGHACVTTGATSYCRRPYTGQGIPCESTATCTGDARFCSSFLRTCLVPDCTEGSCDPGYTCFAAGEFMPGTPNVCVKSEILSR